MPEAKVYVGGGPDIAFRINGDDPTFRLATEEIAAKSLKDIEPLMLDLLEIACVVFAADGAVPRGGPTRPKMGRDWTRDLTFRIPVREHGFWSRVDISDALAEAVEILTGDKVRFRFLPGGFSENREPYLDLDPDGPAFEAEEVIMFSGGLDSFAGALETLASGTSNKVILVTHRSAQKVIPRQQDLGDYLSKRFPGRVLHIQVLARRIGKEALDSSQRSRSFLFAALGQVIARVFGARRVNFFENGIVSHNLPLSPQIIGTMATRTTHPLALRKLDALMHMIGTNPVPTENRFRWLTKTEVVQRIGQHEGKDQIRRAVSCTSVREQNNLHTHCGACTQCLDRRFALLAAGLEQHDPPEDYHTDVLFGARDTVQSKTIALEWTSNSIQFEQLDQIGLLTRHGAEIGRIIRGLSPDEQAADLKSTLNMHHRHAGSVRGVLEAALTRRASDIVRQSFPSTSLFLMYIGQSADTSDIRVPGPSRLSSPPELLPVTEEIDLALEPDDPLQVAFFMDGEKPGLNVRGYCQILGGDARMPHALKPTFDADREQGLPTTAYRYTLATKLPDLDTLSKDAVRALVKRCRKKLSDAFTDIHGVAPPAPLLIQSKSPKGYRLDPTITVLEENHSQE